MNKVALVTGSGRGLGASIIKKLSEYKYNVVINYNKSKKEALLLEQEIKKYNVKTLVVKCDIANENEVKEMMGLIKKKFGRLDVVVNNASIAKDDKFLNKTKDDFLEVLSVNLVGTFLIIKYAFSIMKKGTIINIASTDGIDTYNPYSIDYCASKAGVINLTKNFSLEFRNIKVCAIAPNWINTDTILNMNQEYLINEMTRIGQKKLIDKDKLSNLIIDIINSDKYKSGDIIIVRDGNDV